MDELPCGGYEDEDETIKAQLRAISEAREARKGDCGCEKGK